ncbi:MAG TPA: universal stress protein [Acidimicrobiales bacterium]
MTSTEPQATTRLAGSSHRIVVGVDGSENAERALEWAAAQADRTGAVLDIQTAYEPGYTFITKDEVKRTMERRVEEAAAHVAEVAPRVTTTGGTHEEAPAPALIEASDGADLLVVGSRGLGGFVGLLLGSVSVQCSHHAHCPVTIIR